MSEPTVVSFAGGLFGGMVGTFTTHPLDTVKVWWQQAGNTPSKGKGYVKATLKSTPNPTIMSVCRQNIARDGFRALYKGVVPQMTVVAAEKCLVFGFYDFLRKIQPFDSQFMNTVASGLGAGTLCTMVVVPGERVKILLQQSHSVGWKSPLQQNLVGRAGSGLRYIYQGWGSTLFREVPGYGIYFGTYEALNRYRPPTRWWDTPLYGGLSGFASWVVIYPSDPIKTMIQDSQEPLRYRDAVRTIYRNHGLGGFYRGYTNALARAFCMHAIVFTVVEWFIGRCGTNGVWKEL